MADSRRPFDLAALLPSSKPAPPPVPVSVIFDNGAQIATMTFDQPLQAGSVDIGLAQQNLRTSNFRRFISTSGVSAGKWTSTWNAGALNPGGNRWKYEANPPQLFGMTGVAVEPFDFTGF